MVYNKKVRVDKPLLLLAVMCCAAGALTAGSMQYRGGAETFTEGDTSRLIMGFAVSLGTGVLLGILLCVPGRRTEKLSPLMLAGGLLLTALTFTPLGYAPEGSDDRAWLRFGSIGMQPSELLKLCFILSFAAHLNKVRGHVNRPPDLLMLMLHAAAPTAIVWVQGDQGTAVVFAFITVGMLICAGLDGRLLAGTIALLPAVGFVVWRFVLAEHQRQRILTVLDPSLDPQGTGFQQIQARRAFASGGITGNGLFSLGGDAVYVSQSQNDFVLSYLGRTGGLLLTAGTVILLFALALRLLRLSAARGGYLGLVCSGTSALIFAHTFINTAMELGIMPVIGVPLPFISAGGTARSVMLAAVILCLHERITDIRRNNHGCDRSNREQTQLSREI